MVEANEIRAAFEEMEQRLGQRIDQVEQRLGQRIDRVEQGLGHLGQRIDQVEQGLGQRIDQVEKRFEDFRSEMLGHMDAIYARFDRLETEYHMIVAGLKRVEEAVAAAQEERIKLAADVAVLRSRVAELDARLREVEARLAGS